MGRHLSDSRKKTRNSFCQTLFQWRFWKMSLRIVHVVILLSHLRHCSKQSVVLSIWLILTLKYLVPIENKVSLTLTESSTMLWVWKVSFEHVPNVNSGYPSKYCDLPYHWLWKIPSERCGVLFCLFVCFVFVCLGFVCLFSFLSPVELRLKLN